jgi:hypothetical protein
MRGTARFEASMSIPYDALSLVARPSAASELRVGIDEVARLTACMPN